MQRPIWTEDDFEQMGWHDNKIYAIAFGIKEGEIMFDIDYILRWINPQADETNFRSEIVPATLVFRNMYNLNINFSMLDVTIEGIYRENPIKAKNAAYIKEQVEYEWTIEATD